MEYDNKKTTQQKNTFQLLAKPGTIRLSAMIGAICAAQRSVAVFTEWINDLCSVAVNHDDILAYLLGL